MIAEGYSSWSQIIGSDFDMVACVFSSWFATRRSDLDNFWISFNIQPSLALYS